MQEYALKVPGERAGMRLDLLISAFSKENNLGLSRTAIQDLILKGKVSVKDAPDVKAHYKVKPADKIRIIVEDKVKSTLKAEEIRYIGIESCCLQGLLLSKACDDLSGCLGCLVRELGFELGVDVNDGQVASHDFSEVGIDLACDLGISLAPVRSILPCR